jgi:ribosome maturation factor RimP
LLKAAVSNVTMTSEMTSETEGGDVTETTPSRQPGGMTEIDRVRSLVAPIAADLGFDLYDAERKGGTIRITLDTPPGSPGGITLDELALATRLISREFDHADPIAGSYTLEVTSPGLERNLRNPAHFQREVGKDVTVRLRDPDVAERRIDGTLAAADDRSVTVRRPNGDEVELTYAEIDKARTVFALTPNPKPGGRKPKPAGRTAATTAAASTVAATTNATTTRSEPT